MNQGTSRNKTANAQAPRSETTSRRRVLLVEDDDLFAESVAEVFDRHALRAVIAANLAEAREALRRQSFDVVVLDQKLPDGAGTDLLRELAADPPCPQVILISGLGDVSSAVEAIRLGALDYMVKPFDLDELALKVQRAFDLIAVQRRAEFEQKATACRGTLYPLTGAHSERSRELFRLIDVYSQAAPTPVLILGETGVGKERAARELHARSPRASMPFVPLNCATFDTPLVESELFGHERGAFTGAQTTKTGLIELANGGTLFLDEIGDMPLPAQAKLLRALESRTFRRVGGNREIHSDFWLISATNRDFSPLLDANRFRADLYYRISTLVIEVPSLRERVEDLPDLVQGILAELMGRRSQNITPAPGVLEALASYEWPGNVRELRNVLERALIVNRDGVLRLPADFGSGRATGGNGTGIRSLKEVQDAATRKALAGALAACGGNKSAAARSLDVSIATFKRLLKRHDLS